MFSKSCDKKKMKFYEINKDEDDVFGFNMFVYYLLNLSNLYGM